MGVPNYYRPTFTPAGDQYVQLDGWAAPASDADGTAWIATEVTGWTAVTAVRLSQLERPRRHGVFDGPNFYGPRIVVVAGTTLAQTRALAIKAQDIMASVAAWDSESLFPLVVTEPGQTPRQCMVRLAAETKVSPVYGGLAFDWNLSLTAPDPRRYDTTDTVVDLMLPAANPGGLILPTGVPLTAPLTGAVVNETTLVNNGTANMAPTVTFFGPLTNPAISNNTSGYTLSLAYTLLAGDSLVVDFEARTAMLNGTASRTYALDTSATWWDILPGANDIVFTGAAGTGYAEVRYRSAWH